MRRVFVGLLVFVASLCHAQVTSVFGRTGAVSAIAGDYTAAQVTNAVDSTQTYLNPVWLLTLDWSKITNVPLSVAGTGNLAVGTATMDPASISGNSDTAVGHAALNALTSATDDTAVGEDALVSVTTGSFNTAVGSLAGAYITTGVGNTAVGKQALQMDVSGNDNTAVGQLTLLHSMGNYNTAVGMDSQNEDSTGSFNTSLGQDAMWGGNCITISGAVGYSGSYNTALGQGSFCGVTTGSNNVSVGFESVALMTTGSNNVAIGYQAGYTAIPENQNVSGNNNTWIGYQAGSGTPTQLFNSTAVGANALVSQSNSLVLGGTGVNAVNVGIGTTMPANVFTIAQGAGHAISDGWDTYSSRRWKTNIHTLHGALAKVQQLRGVSYDLTTSGKHEVGVIAEEVGEVVPEVVSWASDGKQAAGVDYGRLTALLIEATKEQQVLINQQQQQIRAQQVQIAQLASQVAEVRARLKTMRRANEIVRTVSAQLAAIHQ
ncbi:MAG TPA: tail fiber domain-containing protein [Terriglobales bacterium]|nr:tail fiber domain-containing protein [Terriglobales bacterium]